MIAVLFVLFLIVSQVTSQGLVPSDIELEFDEIEIRNLNLNLRWKFTSHKTPTRFVLLMEIKRLNYSTFQFEYTLPTLIDDEEVVKASLMEPDNFKQRVEIEQISSIECAMGCINSTRYARGRPFECNIFYYEPTSKSCVLYEYDFNARSSRSPNGRWSRRQTKKRKQFGNGGGFSPAEDIYDSFKDECDMDEILGDVIGYSKLCRKLLDYKDSHVVKINPYIEYRFSLSIRDESFQWTPFLRKEYIYTPKINIELRGELKLGGNVTLECMTDLSPTIVDSITWKNNHPSMKGVLKLGPLTISNLHQTYYCEIRFNYFRMIQKAYKLNLTSLGDLKPTLKLNLTADEEKLNVKINWTVITPTSTTFNPEKIILMYSENNQPYKFVNKYLLFELSKYDYVPIRAGRDYEEITTMNENECAMNCLQRSYCDHFVFIKSVELSKGSKKKNCQLAAANTNNNFFLCRYDLTCANLSPYEKHIKDNTVSIQVLPNITYRFKIQIKDKYVNWTDEIETAPITLPLKVAIKSEKVKSEAGKTNYKLTCSTNVDKSVEQKISWIKDNVDLDTESNNGSSLFIQTSQSSSVYANSMLEFNWLLNRTYEFNGVYKCKIYIRYPEVGQGTYYFSEPVRVTDYSSEEPLSYTKNERNLTVPTIPGLILEIACQVKGSTIKSLKWLVDGVNYNDKKISQTASHDPFVVSIEDKNNSLVNNLLVIRMDYSRPVSKFECILNDNITVRTHYLEILDQRPEYEIKVDTSQLNSLKLPVTITEKKTNKRLSSELSSFIKPLKLSILYVENTTFDQTNFMIIAPNTLSKSDHKQISNLNETVLLGTLKSPHDAIRSCRLSCFNTPFCSSYEYLMFEDSCRFFYTNETHKFYSNMISSLNISLGFDDFNLLNMLELDFVHLLQEESSFNSTSLMDNKLYMSCEPRESSDPNIMNEELHCRDELAEFTSEYVLDVLKPATSYQLRIEVVNAFGKSAAYFTPEIKVPFELNPILEKYEIKNGQEVYSLECSTPLVETKRLQLSWFKDGQLISSSNESISRDPATHEQLINNPTEQHRAFSSELVFRNISKNSHGVYVCQLTYNDDLFPLETNISYVFISRMSPIFEKYEDKTEDVSENDGYMDTCLVEGWPLPSVQWTLNGNVISNKTSDFNSPRPFYRNHHSNMTTIASKLYIVSMNRLAIGQYSCVLNGVQAIKNVSLRMKPAAAESTADSRDRSNSQSSIQDKTNDGKDGSSSVSVALALIFIAMASVGGASAFVYFKKKRISLSTLLSYNRLEEDTVTGVDNINLTDES